MPLIAATLFAASLIAPEARAVLELGRWGLITGDLSQPSIAAARSCEGPWISFAVGENDVRIAQHVGAEPPAAPVEFYRAARAVDDAPHLRIELFYDPADRAAARRYLHDPSVNSLMRLLPDGDGDALYVLCD